MKNSFIGKWYDDGVWDDEKMEVGEYL
ncbi:Imm41 family immunity protein [Neisseria meningitidis]